MVANNHKSLCLVRSSINIDQMFAVPHVVRPGETISSSEMQSRPGGKGANVSAAIGLAGGKIILSGAVGRDAEWPIDELAKRNVKTEKIQVFDDAPTGRAFIQVSKKDGENSIVLLKGANFHPSPKADEPKIVFDSCIDSHSPLTHLVLQNEIPLEITKSFLQYAHNQEENKCLSIFNPSPMLEDDIVRSFAWNQVDVLIVNEGEGEDLLKALGQSNTKGTDGGDVLDRLANVSELKETCFIVMTKGARGVSAYVDPVGIQKSSNRSESKRIRIDEPAFKPKQVRDTTGAGDTFAGFLVAGLMRLHDNQKKGEKQDEDSIKSVLRLAIVAAALAVEQDGAMESIPRLETVQKREKESH